MSLPRLVLCLTLLGSSLGFAQAPEEWTPYTAPANQGPTPPPLVPASPPSEPPASAPPASEPPTSEPSASEPPASEPPRNVRIRPIRASGASEGSQTALRLVVAPFGGTVTGMMGLIIGAVPTALIALPFCVGSQDFDNPGCAIAVTTGLSLSYTAGVSLGITFIGGVLGGRGELMPTVFGSLAGAAVGAGIGVATQSIPGLLIGLAVGPLVGAVTGYEFSHAEAPQAGKPALQARSGFHVMPMASATPRGGLLAGLAGQF
jgi:hypothetical protein